MTSMLDQYEQASQYPKSNQTSVKAPPMTSSGFVNMQVEENIPIFSKQKMNFNPSDIITHISVANDNLVLAMANSKIFRINLKDSGAHEDIALSKYTQNGSKVNGIYLDPLGCHLLISLIPKTNENYPELLYLHKKSTKIKSVGKSKSYEITQVGWNFENTLESSTGAILLGTSKGLILETEIGYDGDKIFQSGIEQYWKQVFDVGKGTNTAITGIEFRRITNTNRYFIFITTHKRLYQFAGQTNPDDKPLLQQIFNMYLNIPESGFLEVRLSSSLSKFHTYSNRMSSVCKSFGWLTECGLYYGQIDTSIMDSKSITPNSELIAYPPNGLDESSTPLDFVLTEFHGLLLYEDCIKAISLLDKEVILEDLYSESLGRLVNVTKDLVKHTIWAITDKAVFRYKVFKEQRNVWKVFAENNQFELARKYCDNNLVHLDKVNVKEAEMLFSNGDFEKSAEIYANTQSGFESICLKFLNEKHIEALKIYLQRKLENLLPSDKIQTTMLVVWLVELYLSQLGQLRYQESKNSTNYKKIEKEFETFLSLPNVINCIKRNKSVVYDLLASHGDKDNLITLSVINKDFENVIRHHIYKKSYDEALNVLKVQSKRDLFYIFTPILLQEIPKMTVNALIEQGKNLSPTKILPALVSCETDETHITEMIRYLEFCTQSLRCTDQAIHNYLLSLYVNHNTTSLMLYLSSQGHNTKTIYYDVHYALRLCREKKLTKACVQLSSIMGLWESAVELALPVDVELAKNIANMLEDVELKKKLWLKIADFVISGKQDVSQAMEFLQQCDLIKIEDILPFFSDFVTIDRFKDPICNSLQEYNQKIQDEREEMEEATRSAEQVRSDIQTFRNGCTVISINEPCILCGITLLIRPFYLFPCGHKFHTDCLTSELQPLLGPAKQNKLASLHRQLNSFYLPMEPTEDMFSDKYISKEQIRNEIDNILAFECLYCGEYMIQSIDSPFIPDADWDKVMKEWE